MASFTANDVMLDIEKLETMLTSSSNSSISSESTCITLSPPELRSATMHMRFTGSSKIYLRNLNKLLAEIEEKQKILSSNSGSILKRLNSNDTNHNHNSTTSRPLTFSMLFARPSIKFSSKSRTQAKMISFSQLMTIHSNSTKTYSNHQSQYGCARLNEKMWVPHCREQLMKAVQDECEQTSQTDVDEENFDWNHISDFYLDQKWSGRVCKNAWKQVCNPKINQSKWTIKEERRLISIVEREPLTADRWTAIAQELGTDRSAYLCAKRYMQITNEIYSKRPLDADERQRIISAIQQDNQGHYTKYNQLAYQLGDRTREFIYNQWIHIDPSCKRGRWTDDEQAQLLTRINQQTHKITNWPLISAPVRTRSSRQCRERALDTLKNGHRPCKEKHRLFTSDEDRLLLELYAVHGAKWSLIAKEFPSRTDNSLLVRYRMLIKAKTQWNWFCQISPDLKRFLTFLYEKSNNDAVPVSNEQDLQNEITQDLEQFGFYRRGIPLAMTDDEFQWFQNKPDLIRQIAAIALNEFREKHLCCRKFKAEIKSWFMSASVPVLTDDEIRQMLCRTIPNRRKRKPVGQISLSTNKKSKMDNVDCKEEPKLLALPSILSATSRHILRPVANQFFTSQSTSKLSVNNSSAHFCPYLILIRQNS